VLILREAERADAEIQLTQGVHLWDRRFTLLMPEAAGGRAWRLRRAGRARKTPGQEGLPAPVRPSLPALHDLDGIAALPHLSWVRPGIPAAACPSAIRFTPPQGLTEAEFRVASQGLRVI
jgi:hypothetical protein